MKKDILDTNVLIRFLVGDNAAQKEQAKTWFREAQRGKRDIVVTPLVIAETCFVLESFYKKRRDEITQAMEVFVSQRWLHVQEREVMQGLWQRYRDGFHFVDSFLLSFARAQDGRMLTFDQKLKRAA